MRTIAASPKRRVHNAAVLFAAAALALPAAVPAQGLAMNPTRPTIANGSSIQDRGLLQVEVGYDAFPQRVPGNQQTVSLFASYAPAARLRLDLGFSPFAHQGGDGVQANGMGTVLLGGKVVLHDEQHHLRAPGVALQYEAELPTASNPLLQGYGQQIILLINHHYGPDGLLDVIVNGSLVQADCETETGCSYGGQHALALSYHLNPRTRLYAELSTQNKSQSNAPPGTYVFGGFYHEFSDNFGLDGGMRFGVTDHAASVGTSVGVVFGKHLGHDAGPARR